MKNLLLLVIFLPFTNFSQTSVDSIYVFNIGDEFHYEITDSNTLIKKFEKRIVLSITQFGGVYQFQIDGRTKYPTISAIHSYSFVKTINHPGPGMIATDTVAPCNSSSHFHYNSTYSDPTIGLYICKFTDTIITRNDYGPTYVRYYYSSNKYSIIDNFSTGLGRSLRIEKYSDSAGYYTVTEKLVYYKKDSINKTWGTPVAFNIGLDELNTLDFSVYPNPASNFINVSGIDNNKTEYEVLNSLGKLVVSGSLNSQKIDCSTLSNGIYFLKLIDSDNNRGVKRIVVAR